MRRRSIGVVAVLALALALIWWRGREPEAPRAGGALAPPTVEEVAADPELVAQPSPESAPARAPARDLPLATASSDAPTEAAATAPATLDVLVRSKQSGLPMEGIRLCLVLEAFAEADTPRSVESARGSASAWPRTGEDGRAVLALPPGSSATLRAIGDPTRTNARTVELEPLRPGEVRPLVVELDTEAELLLRGIVLARATREPIAGARVTVGPAPDPSATARALSDAAGRFAVEFASFERAPLCVAAPGFGHALVPLREGYDAPERALEVLLEPSAALTVTLLDGAAAPLEDVLVRLSTPRFGLAQHASLDDPALFGDASWSARTDPRGVARFDALPARAPLTVAARVERGPLTGGPAPVRLEPGEARALEWRAGGGASIAVRALDSGGDPLAGLELALERARSREPYLLRGSSSDERRSATTDDQGRARFVDVPPGEWAVAPAPRDHAARSDDDAAPLAQIIMVPPAGEVGLELLVWRGLWIRGRVLAPDGTPSASGFVLAERPGDDWFTECEVESGAFAVGPVAPGRWRLTARYARHAPSAAVEAAAGSVDVELRLREAARIAGVVVDGATGLPLRARVGIASTGADGSVRLSIRSRDGGEFELLGFAAGVYDVSASVPGVLFALARGVRAELGAEPARIELRMEPGAGVRLRFDGPAERAQVELSSAGALCSWSSVVRGDELVLTGPPGRATLRLRTYPGGVEHERELDLVAGEELGLDFDAGW